MKELPEIELPTSRHHALVIVCRRYTWYHLAVDHQIVNDQAVDQRSFEAKAVAFLAVVLIVIAAATAATTTTTTSRF
jgi:hypothetical protein